MMSRDPRQHLVAIARLVYERRLTDASGGNLSLRQGNRIYMTPAKAGSRQQWRIASRDIVAMDFEGKAVDGAERRSREWQMHLGIYKAFELAGGVIHGQAGYLMAFVAAAKPMPSVLEHTQKFGTIGLARPAAAHSAELAQNVVEALGLQKEALAKHAIATLIPRHGIIVVGRDLADAFDALDRLETNAQALLLGKLIETRHAGIS